MLGHPFLFGPALGLVSAIVFASATTGPLVVRFLLFFITSLPIFLAGLGWGPTTAVLAGLAGTALVAVSAGPLVGLAFAASQVVPVIVLSYLALLSRAGPPGPGGGETIEWYPPGRLVVSAALMAACLSVVSVLLLGGSHEEIKSSLGTFIDKMVKSDLPQMQGSPALGEAEISSLAEITAAVLPAASGISWMASLLFNLWLAGRITLASGQLRRPWPDLAAIEYPRGTALLFAGSLIALLSKGNLALAATGFTGTLFLAYVLLGLAIVHYTTRGKSWRPFALWALYATLLVVNVWIAVLIASLGLAESVVGLRRRTLPPPSGTST